MILCLSEKSIQETARRKGRLVFRGYAETVEKCRSYPKQMRDRLLIEAPERPAVERVLRGANISAIRSPRWALDGFRIIEIHPDNPALVLQEWYYDPAMALRHHAVHDRRVRFHGRLQSDCLYSVGERVVCRRGDSLELGRVLAQPLTPAEVQAGKARGFYLAFGAPMPPHEQVYADQSEDTYVIEYLEGSEDDFDNYAEWQLRPVSEEGSA